MKKRTFDLRTRRLELNQTLEETGRLAGITAEGVRQIETGMVKATFLTKAKLAEALQCTLWDLLSEEEIAAAEKLMEEAQEARTAAKRRREK